MIKVGEKAKIQIDWPVQPVNYSRERAENIAHKFAKKYGVPVGNITVEPKFIVKRDNGEDAPLTNELIVNIQDPKFQQKLFVEYAKDNDIKDFDREAINDIDSQINSQIDYEVYDKFKKYEVKWIKWKNFLSYGEDNMIDFTTLHGLVHLKGEPANESGKSTLAYDILHFLLFGKASSDKADIQAKLFNRYIPEATECSVEGCLCIDGQDYIIRRVLSRPKLDRRSDKSKVTQKISYFKVTNGVETELDDIDNMGESTGTETNKAIKEAIGNEKDFDLVISANADNLKALISLKDTERGRLLSRWIGLLPLEEKDAKAREKWNHDILPSLYSTKYNREELKTEIDDINEKIGEYEEEIEKREKQKKSLMDDIKALNDAKDALIASKQTVDADLLNIDVSTVEQKIKDTTVEGKKKAAEKKEKEERLKEIGDVEFSEEDYKAEVNKKSALEVTLAEYRTEINTLKALNKQLEESEYCPTCGRKFDDVDNSGKIKENEKKIKTLTESGIKKKAEKDEIEENIENLEATRKVFNEKNRLEIQIEALEANINSLRHEYKSNTELKKRYETNKSLISKNNEIDLSIRNTAITIQQKENDKTRIINEIAGYNKDIENYKEEIKTKNGIINQINAEDKLVRDWKIYLQMVSKDGIGKMVIRQALPIINGELKRLLDGVCDFEVEVAIDDHNDVAFNIVRDGVVGNLASGSGYEKTAASIALRAVLGKISTMPKPSFILLDEVLGGVAEENYDNIKKLYDRILPDYSFIFHISHLAAVEEWAEQTVVVKKENNISKVLEINK